MVTNILILEFLFEKSQAIISVKYSVKTKVIGKLSNGSCTHSLTVYPILVGEEVLFELHLDWHQINKI